MVRGQLHGKQLGIFQSWESDTVSSWHEICLQNFRLGSNRMGQRVQIRQSQTLGGGSATDFTIFVLAWHWAAPPPPRDFLPVISNQHLPLCPHAFSNGKSLTEALELI